MVEFLWNDGAGFPEVGNDACVNRLLEQLWEHRRQFLDTGTEKVFRNVVFSGSFPCAGSLQLACHVVFGDDDLSRGGGGDGCQKLCAFGCKVLAVEASVEFS